MEGVNRLCPMVPLGKRKRRYDVRGRPYTRSTCRLIVIRNLNREIADLALRQLNYADTLFTNDIALFIQKLARTYIILEG